MNISTNDKGQQVIQAGKPNGVTWSQVINGLVDKTLFPAGSNNKSLDSKMYRDRANNCASEMFNLLVFVKQRCIADIEQEIRRLELMRKDIEKDIKSHYWFWQKLPFKKELKECTQRINGLDQARQIVHDTTVEGKPDPLPEMKVV